MSAFAAPTTAQESAWIPIARRESTLLLAPTGSGKTLAAFLAAIDRMMFQPVPEPKTRCRVLYVSPLKALGVDVERNLRAPLVGISNMADKLGVSHHEPRVGVRTGDTASADRARLVRQPPDILITTPESLYLMLTSRAREILRFVETVIVDEIHSVLATKRGAHLALSLERLERLRAGEGHPPLQRIGLSATQRPPEEAARLLGGGTVSAGGTWRARPVAIVDVDMKKTLELRIEVPVEDMSDLTAGMEAASDQSENARPTPSIWPSIHPRLVELVRQHRSTIIFVNSRRLAERLAGAINEQAGEELALAHHGSIAKEKRALVEDRLKRGNLPAIVATSSLELGIDMGAVDLVIQIEAPPSVTSGMQRIGRAGHQVGAPSRGIVFPKFRGDLLAATAAVGHMKRGKVEESTYPRNPLDVLAQQLVAMVAEGPCAVDALHDAVRSAAPFAELPRTAFEGVLDMLSGRYPSEEFAELRPRVTWDRMEGVVHPRRGAQRIAIANGGTIPDRGLFGVFLATGGETSRSRRVGELDEEMVFESQPGDIFLLGATSWRIEEINVDRVLVSPAPGEPGRMPFWRGDRPGRPISFGRAIGATARTIAEKSDQEALSWLEQGHELDERAARNLVAYIREQVEATQEFPSDRTIIVERFLDEIGDWRVCVLSPFGARAHAPWAIAVRERLEEAYGRDLDVVWSDDGIVFRIPEAEDPPPEELFIPRSAEIEDAVVAHLAETPLFAGHFRENAARALLLPRRRPGQRTPLWAQRRRSADLLKVAARFSDFPIILETMRECLRDVFDLPALVELAKKIESREIAVRGVTTKYASPFAASLLFNYVANFIYNGDAPLAEQRAQALAIDYAQLRELLGEAQLRELFDPEVIKHLGRRLQRLHENQRLRDADDLHDLLRAIGDLSRAQIVERVPSEHAADGWIQALAEQRRIIEILIAGEARWAAAEDAGRFRDALGIVPPLGLPSAFLDPVRDALAQLLSRYARTHTPFTADEVAHRFGISATAAEQELMALEAADRLVQGEFLPGRRGREWCAPEVLRQLKQQSLAKLRREVEPVDHATFARFSIAWNRIGRTSRGIDALLEAIEKLQGAALPASALEEEVLPARVDDFVPYMLDELLATGEIVWRGVEPIGLSDGRIALYLEEHYDRLAPPIQPAEGAHAERVREILAERGALFFADLQSLTGAFPADLKDALWSLVWSGEVSNDTLTPLRSLLAESGARKTRGVSRRSERLRRRHLPGTEGRWRLLAAPTSERTSTERRAALTTQLLERHGVLTREALRAEGLDVRFASIYPVLKAMEDQGRARRGYFVEGLGVSQFALPGADDRLRQCRDDGDAAPVDNRDDAVVVLAATDPANPYGAALPWPAREGARPQRVAGGRVYLLTGRMIGYLSPSEQNLLTFLPEGEPDRTRTAKALAKCVGQQLERDRRRAMLITSIDGDDPERSPLAPFLSAEGFRNRGQGLWKRRSELPRA